MEESRDYKKYPTISPLPTECAKKYEEELRSSDSESRIQDISFLREELTQEDDRKRKAVISSIKPPEILKTGVIFKKYSVAWDCIWFGKYPQMKDADGTFVNDLICWRVLDIKDGVATLLSNDILDVETFVVRKPFFTKEQNDYYSAFSSYAYVTLLGRLNLTIGNSFLQKAFSEKERGAILGTNDKIKLLPDKYILQSQYSVYGFNYAGKIIEKSCMCEYSDYALSKGLNAQYPYGNWIAETYQKNMYQGMLVNPFGRMDYLRDGQVVGIRPMITVDLKQLEYVHHESRYVKVTT